MSELQSIQNIKEYRGKKVIVLGKGGLGKSSCINSLTNNRSQFAIGDGSDDVTKDIQYYIDDVTNICYIDTPGLNHNITKWYKDLLEIGSIDGVLCFLRPEQRNTDYADFQYIITYLKECNHYHQICIRAIDPPIISIDNMIYGALSLELNNQNVALDTWIKNIPSITGKIRKSFVIYSPIGLISIVNNLNLQLEEIKKDHEILTNEIITIQKILENERSQSAMTLRILKNRKKKLLDMVNELGQKDPDTNKLITRAPSRWLYPISILPGIGPALLYEYRIFFKRARKMAGEWKSDMEEDRHESHDTDV